MPWQVSGLFANANQQDEQLENQVGCSDGWRWGGRSQGLWEGAYLLWRMSFGPWHLKPASVTALSLVKRMRAQETTHLSSMTRPWGGGRRPSQEKQREPCFHPRSGRKTNFQNGLWKDRNGDTQRPQIFLVCTGVQVQLFPPFFRSRKPKKCVFLYFIKLREKMALNSFYSPAIIIYFQTLLQGTAPSSYPGLLLLINEPSLQ